MTNILSKPNVAVVAGGNSSEFVVSVKSGANVMQAVDPEKFNPWLVEIQNDRWEVFQNNYKVSDIDKSDFSFQFQGEKIKFDFAYITIHGTPGGGRNFAGLFRADGHSLLLVQRSFFFAYL